MADEDSLLDVFVNVGTKGIADSQQEIDDFVARTKKAFADIKLPASKPLNIPVSLSSKDLAAEFDEIKKRFTNLNRLLSFESQGKLDISKKLGVAQLEYEMRDVVITFDILNKKTGKTASDLAQMANQVQIFKQNAAAIQEIKENAIATGAATNTLSNNAYQVGQAFEDAAIGYQLNGITGAVRGAANNVSFLVNNMAQAGSLTTLLGESAAKLAPLYFGVGTAALFIVPSLYKWLTTLGDIEEKTIDLAELMRREFEDIDFRVSLSLDTIDAIRAVEDSKDYVDAIEEIIKQAQDSDRLKLKLTSELDAQAAAEAVRSFRIVENQIEEALQNRFRDVSVIPIDPFGAAAQVDPEDTADFKRVQKLIEALNTLKEARQKTFAEAGKGVVDADSIAKTSDALRLLSDNFGDINAGNERLSDERIKEIESALGAMKDEFGKTNEEAQKLKNTNENLLGPVLDKALIVSERVSRELLFQRDIAAGRKTEEDRILFTMQEEVIAVEKENARMVALLGNTEKVAALRENSLKRLKDAQEITLLKEIAELELKLAEDKRANEREELSALERRIDIEERIADLLDKQNNLKSKRSALGDTGQTVFGDESDDNKRLEELQRDLLEAQRQEAEKKKENTEQVAKLTAEITKLKDALAGKGLLEDPAKKQAIEDIFVGPIEDAEIRRKRLDARAQFAPEEDPAREETIGEAIRRAKREKVESDEERDRRRAEFDARPETQRAKFDEELAARKKAREETEQKEKESREAESRALRARQEELARERQKRQEVIDEEQRAMEARRDLSRDIEQNRIIEERRSRMTPEEFAAERKALEAQAASALEEANKARERQKEMEKTFEQNQKSELEKAIEEDERRQKEARERFGVNGQSSSSLGPFFAPEDRVVPSFAPEDGKNFIEAQAEANSRAMENTNFTSKTLETLIATSNELLGRMNENVAMIDSTSRYA